MKIARHLHIGHIICVLSLFGGIFSAPISQAATYYVALYGNDSNPGTETQPFREIGRGASVLRPGDTLYVREGTYRESFWDSIPSGTSWDASVTIAAFPGETVTIRPEPGSERVFLFQGEDTHHIIVDGFIMDAANVSYDVIKISYGDDPDADNAHSIRITNSEIKNGPYNGILAMGDDNSFVNLEIHNNGRTLRGHGIYINSSDNLIEGCEIYNNSGWGAHVYGEGDKRGQVNNNVIKDSNIYSNGGAGIILSAGTSNQAYNNEIWENGGGGIQVDYGASNTKVSDNEVYRNDIYGIYIGGGSVDAIMENNDVYDNNGISIADYGISTILLP